MKINTLTGNTKDNLSELNKNRPDLNKINRIDNLSNKLVGAAIASNFIGYSCSNLIKIPIVSIMSASASVLAIPILCFSLLKDYKIYKDNEYNVSYIDKSMLEGEVKYLSILNKNTSLSNKLNIVWVVSSLINFSSQIKNGQDIPSVIAGTSLLISVISSLIHYKTQKEIQENLLVE